MNPLRVIGSQESGGWVEGETEKIRSSLRAEDEEGGVDKGLEDNLALLVRDRDEPISKCVTGASLEQKRAEIKMGEMGSSPDRSKCVHALGGSPRQALGFCDLLDIPRCHVDGEGWGV
jgi:hypothetical protein